MGALLGILMFVFFVTLDWLLSRRSQTQAVAAVPAGQRPELAPEPALAPVWVAGYELPEQLHYHPGHTWVRPTGHDTAVVGIDDFARKLIGGVKALKIPRAGSWLLQGARAFDVDAGGRTAGLVSPVEGEVIEVNPALRQKPELAASDPYGRGWLCKIRAPHLATHLRNLVRGGLARKWTEESRDQLELELMAASGSVLRDGGELASDFASHLDSTEWNRLVGRFLLT